MADKHPLGELSLWIIPSGDSRQKLQTTITDLARLEAESITFDPHITLYYPIPAATDLDELQTQLRAMTNETSTSSFDVSLRPAQAGKSFYQSVLAPVEPTPALLKLRAKCEETFGKIDKPYFPHLSLLYGDLSQERRDEIAQIANVQGLPTSITAGAIVVVDTRGTADQWQVVATVEL